MCSSRQATVRKGLSSLVLSLSKFGVHLGWVGEDTDALSRVTCPGIAAWPTDSPAVEIIECRVDS